MVTEYRPTFVLWTSFLNQLPLQLFFTVWAGGFFGGLLTSMSPGLAKALQASVGSPFLVIGLTVLVLFPVATLAAKRLNYANTTYRLRPDRIEIEEGFFTVHRKEVRISAIRETSLRRSVLQRLVGLGSVYVATQATGQGSGWRPSALLGSSSTFGSGLMMMDLGNAEEAYGHVRALADRTGELAV